MTFVATVMGYERRTRINEGGEKGTLVFALNIDIVMRLEWGRESLYIVNEWKWSGIGKSSTSVEFV